MTHQTTVSLTFQTRAPFFHSCIYSTASQKVWRFIAGLLKTAARPLCGKQSELSVGTGWVTHYIKKKNQSENVISDHIPKRLPSMYPLAKIIYIIALRIMQTCSIRRAALYDSSSLDSACGWKIWCAWEFVKQQIIHWDNSLCFTQTSAVTCLRNCRPK